LRSVFNGSIVGAVERHERMDGLELELRAVRSKDFAELWQVDAEIDCVRPVRSEGSTIAPYDSFLHGEAMRSMVARKVMFLRIIASPYFGVLGCVKIFPVPGCSDITPQISFAVHIDFRCQGIATWGVGQTIAEVMPSQIEAFARSDNIASLRVLERNGFREVSRTLSRNSGIETSAFVRMDLRQIADKYS
jgi:RimJ/RimL family protein N-acetyltransferase